MKHSWAVLPAFVLLCSAHAQSDDRKTATALLADGQKLEADMRTSGVTLGQLGAAIAKIDIQLGEIENLKKSYETEAGTSDPAKARMEPLLAGLAVKRKPLDQEKAALEA